MKRRYQRELYVDRVAKIKELMPNCCIGVDVIVGFPGETQQDFLDTYEFLNGLDVSYLHVFTYSEREQTEAAVMKGKVTGSTRFERNKMLHILSDKKRRAFYESQVGASAQVLFEDDQKNGFMHGFTKNYVKVKAKYDPLMVNELKEVKLVALTADGEVEVAELETVYAHH
jgi:threonylcarbamoyladenosine tRNA methylthiotransferase MtaB